MSPVCELISLSHTDYYNISSLIMSYVLELIPRADFMLMVLRKVCGPSLVISIMANVSPGGYTNDIGEIPLWPLF